LSGKSCGGGVPSGLVAFLISEIWVLVHMLVMLGMYK